jgi:hypothetical protein
MTGLSDKDMAVIFKKDAGDYMIAAENLRTDEHSIYLVAPTYFLRGGYKSNRCLNYSGGRHHFLLAGN